LWFFNILKHIFQLLVIYIFLVKNQKYSSINYGAILMPTYR